MTSQALISKIHRTLSANQKRDVVHCIINSVSVDNITLLDLQNSSYPTQPHSIIALLFIQNIFKLLKEKMSSMFFCSPKITQPRPQIFSVNGLLICSGLHF